jgi:hypothetical protein
MWHVYGREEVPTGIWWGILRERNHFKYLRVDGKEILKWIFNGLELAGSGYGQVADSRECGNKPSDFKNARHFLTR